MKITNLKIKDINTVSTIDKINVIETVASFYFRELEDEYGNSRIEYTPYLSKIGKIIAAAENLLDGIEFDEKEDVYNSVMNNPDVLSLVNGVAFSAVYVNGVTKNKLLEMQSLFDDLMEQVKDVVEYRKSENLAKLQNDSNSILVYKLSKLLDAENEKAEMEKAALENLNKWIDEQRELNSLITPEMQKEFAETFNIDSLMDTMIKKYGESDLHKRNQEVIEANKKIRELDNKIVEMKKSSAKEKKKEKARDAGSDMNTKE